MIGAGYQSRTGDWTLARFCFTTKLIPQLCLAESVGVEPTQRLVTVAGLAIPCLTIRPTFLLFGSPAWARSTDLLINSQTLLPTELLGNKTFLNICMATANVNLGIEALLRYASTDTYQEHSSWTTVKEFTPVEWWQRRVSNLPHTDFQSAALPDELRRL